MIPYMCSECGDRLTAEEYEYYTYRCTACERNWHDRVDAWRHGSPDAELDKLHDECNVKPIVH